MKKFLLIATITPFLSFANKSDSSLDKYHYIISQWILDKTDLVDRYLSDIHDTKKENHTTIDISIEFGKFTRTDSLYHNVDFSIHLDLPRLKNKLKLTLEKVSKNSTLLNKNREKLLSKSSDNSDEGYNLALSYAPWDKRRFFVSFDGGVRFDNYFIEPYVGILSGYKIKKSKKVEANVRNSLRFYLAGEVKDLLLGEYFYKYNENVVLGWMGSFVYSSEQSTQSISTEFFALRLLNKDSFARVGFISNFHLHNFKNPKKDDFELYFKYHNKLLNKKWLYYEITPSLNWKRKDNYKTSVGLKVKIGATFGAVK